LAGVCGTGGFFASLSLRADIFVKLGAAPLRFSTGAGFDFIAMKVE
jgi:hypothetical protein